MAGRIRFVTTGASVGIIHLTGNIQTFKGHIATKKEAHYLYILRQLI